MSIKENGIAYLRDNDISLLAEGWNYTEYCGYSIRVQD